MDWKKWKIYGFYKKIWSVVGGRPWTYIARDIYHRFEYVILVSLFVGGFVLGKSGVVSWKWLLAIMFAYTIGFMHGHFFWGNKYVPGQQGD